MYNEELLSDITEGNSWILGHCNVGTISTNKKGIVCSVDLCINKDGIDNFSIIPKLEDIVYTLPMTARMDTTLDTTRIERSSSTRMIWFYLI